MSKAQGFLAEEQAAGFLNKMGYTILDRNVTFPFGELDIVAKDKETLVFVEVKHRFDTIFGDPLEAITPAKRRKIIMAAKAYLAKKEEMPFCRFDVITLVGDLKNPTIEHLLDAFWAEF